ncbi:hypothetical protein ACO0K0_13165 [Undibacterium sp. SXout11W]|uniref:hypothetical protein n=1 Tax=Undibacterium sp. SXout11W TaxID=3413050 RepID=UPI003BEF5FB6
MISITSFVVLLFVLISSSTVKNFKLKTNKASELEPTRTSGDQNRLFLLSILLIGLICAYVISSLAVWDKTNQASIQIGAGILLFLIAIKTNFTSHIKENIRQQQITRIVENTGMMSGVAVLVLLCMSQNSGLNDYLMSFCSMAATIFIFERLSNKWGQCNTFSMLILSIQKALGLLLCAIAIEKILRGLHLYFS